MIDTVSTMYRCDWEKACNLPVYEFLNVYSYSIAKNRFEVNQQKAAYEQIKNKYR